MKYTILTAFIVAWSMLSSCTGDSPDIPSATTADVGITLRAVSSKTRTSADPESNEIIHNYKVAFVSQGMVRKIVTNGDDFTPAESDGFKIDLLSGTYDVYAFANINEDLGFAEGSPVPEDLSSKTWESVPVYGDAANNLVPMSGFLKDVAISQDKNIAIEVVRLVAKMELNITNASQRGITIQSLSLQPAKNGTVTLLPDYATLGSAPALISGTVCQKFTRELNAAIEVGNTVDDKFYLLESTATGHPTGHYVLKLDIAREGSDKTESLSALMKNLEWINRNDYIVQPLKIIDFTLTLDANFYPPIGGYPAILEERHGDEYYFTFGSSGKFVILPKITDSDGNVLAREDYSVKISAATPENFYSKVPSYEGSKEIIGELKTQGASGTSTVDLEITYTDKGSGTKALSDTEKTYTFNRTLHIIRK